LLLGWRNCGFRRLLRRV